MELVTEGSVKDGRKVQLFRANDGRFYLFRISINAREGCYYERVPKGDRAMWIEALRATETATKR